MSEGSAAGECRFASKRTFATEDDARLGALEIKTVCALNHRSYTELFPYPCPDGDHWHLSHWAQGTGLCGTCNEMVPAWKGWWWVIGRHYVNHQPCKGEGSRAADDTTSPGRSCAGE